MNITCTCQLTIYVKALFNFVASPDFFYQKLLHFHMIHLAHNDRITLSFISSSKKSLAFSLWKLFLFLCCFIKMFEKHLSLKYISFVCLVKLALYILAFELFSLQLRPWPCSRNSVLLFEILIVISHHFSRSVSLDTDNYFTTLELFFLRFTCSKILSRGISMPFNL